MYAYTFKTKKACPNLTGPACWHQPAELQTRMPQETPRPPAHPSTPSFHTSSAPSTKGVFHTKLSSVLFFVCPWYSWIVNSPNMHNTGFFPGSHLLSVTNGSIWIPQNWKPKDHVRLQSLVCLPPLVHTSNVRFGIFVWTVSCVFLRVCVRVCVSMRVFVCVCSCVCVVVPVRVCVFLHVCFGVYVYVCFLSSRSFPLQYAVFPRAWKAPWSPSTLRNSQICCGYVGGLCLLGSRAFWLHTTVLETSTYISLCICPDPPSPSEHTKRHSLSLRTRRGFLPAWLGLYVCTFCLCLWRPVRAVLADALNLWALPQCPQRIVLYNLSIC